MPETITNGQSAVPGNSVALPPVGNCWFAIGVFSVELAWAAYMLGEAMGVLLRSQLTGAVAKNIGLLFGLIGGAALGLAGAGGSALHGFTWFGIEFFSIVLIGAFACLGSYGFLFYARRRKKTQT